VNDLRIQRPADVPVRLEVAKGATKVALGNRSVGAVGGGLADQTSGYDESDARYLVIIAGGADTVTVA
jgi:hypothetical protein